MSLKDAIREAVDARDNPNTTPEVPETQEVTSASPRDPEPQTQRQSKSQAKRQVRPEIKSEPLEEGTPASSKAINTLSKKAVKQADIPLDETAAMTVRVSRRHRLHWLIAAKKEGTSLTAAIVEALNARFGEPSD